MLLQHVNDILTCKTGFISPDKQLLARLNANIERDFKEHKSLLYYASKINLSLKVINKILKHHRNTTLHVPLNARIYRETFFLLKHTTMSNKLIAFELEMEPVYFNRWFKKITGISPSQYRRQ